MQVAGSRSGEAVYSNASPLRRKLPSPVNRRPRWPGCSAILERPQCYHACSRSLLPLYLFQFYFCSLFLWGIHATPITEELPVLSNVIQWHQGVQTGMWNEKKKRIKMDGKRSKKVLHLSLIVSQACAQGQSAWSFLQFLANDKIKNFFEEAYRILKANTKTS